MKKVDKLPFGPGFSCRKITVTGNRLGEDKEPIQEELELWMRDPVECIKELVGNPAFKEKICYVPEQVFTSNDRKTRIIDEAWTADWWWETQVRARTVLTNGKC
jgi:hypothetical protein